MNIEDLREYCLSIKGSSECMPFDDTVVAFKVMGKMFAYFSLVPKDGVFSVNLKCDPEKAIELREQFEGVQPGFHANKKYWNTITLESDVSDILLKELVTHSLDEVIIKLPKTKREEYRNNQ